MQKVYIHYYLIVLIYFQYHLHILFLCNLEMMDFLIYKLHLFLRKRSIVRTFKI